MDLESVTFGYNDICDRCGARCYAKAFMNGLELLFCIHHIYEHGQTLFESGWEIVSNSEAMERIGARVPTYV